MANEEHLAVLRQGVNVWNAWQVKRGEIRNVLRVGRRDIDLDFFRANLIQANLREANLSGVNLHGADLSRANVQGANLHGADLTRASLCEANLSKANLIYANLAGADLRETNLAGADLRETNLTGADLRETNLGGVNLHGADLSRANLYGVNLIRADLREANLAETRIYETGFVDIDLSTTKGLETCLHYGPSIIDHRTLQRSGRLPLAFLRGCGLPDRLIEYLPSLLGEAIQYYSCFISYSSKDEAFTQRLHADLQNSGVRCWFAPHDLPIGAKTWDVIDAAIRVRDKLLLILSKNSLASDWVEDEVSKAFAEERRRGQVVLFPVRIDNAVIKTAEPWAVKLREQGNIGDFTRWKEHDAYQKSLERVLRDLKAERADVGA